MMTDLVEDAALAGRRRCWLCGVPVLRCPPEAARSGGAVRRCRAHPESHRIVDGGVRRQDEGEPAGGQAGAPSGDLISAAAAPGSRWWGFSAYTKKNMVPDLDDKLTVIESSHERRRCYTALATTVEQQQQQQRIDGVVGRPRRRTCWWPAHPPLT